MLCHSFIFSISVNKKQCAELFGSRACGTTFLVPRGVVIRQKKNVIILARARVGRPVSCLAMLLFNGKKNVIILVRARGCFQMFVCIFFSVFWVRCPRCHMSFEFVRCNYFFQFRFACLAIVWRATATRISRLPVQQTKCNFSQSRFLCHLLCHWSVCTQWYVSKHCDIDHE